MTGSQHELAFAQAVQDMEPVEPPRQDSPSALKKKGSKEEVFADVLKCD